MLHRTFDQLLCKFAPSVYKQLMMHRITLFIAQKGRKMIFRMVCGFGGEVEETNILCIFLSIQISPAM